VRRSIFRDWPDSPASSGWRACRRRDGTPRPQGRPERRMDDCFVSLTPLGACLNTPSCILGANWRVGVFRVTGTATRFGEQECLPHGDAAAGPPDGAQWKMDGCFASLTPLGTCRNPSRSKATPGRSWRGGSKKRFKMLKKVAILGAAGRRKIAAKSHF